MAYEIKKTECGHGKNKSGWNIRIVRKTESNAIRRRNGKILCKETD